MKIEINDHRKVFAVQNEFNKLFPSLRIEFLAKPSKVGNTPSKKKFKEPSKTLGECRVIHTKGELTLSPAMTVADLQQTFSDTYGLSITIFHKVDGKWIETNKNGSLSLKEQNELVLH